MLKYFAVGFTVGFAVGVWTCWLEGKFMGAQNTLALPQMFRAKGVTAARTPAGVQFFCTGVLTAGEKKTLAQLSQAALEAALKWQR